MEVGGVDVAQIAAIVVGGGLKASAGGTIIIGAIGVILLIARLPNEVGRERIAEDEGGGSKARRTAAIRIVAARDERRVPVVRFAACVQDRNAGRR